MAKAHATETACVEKVIKWLEEGKEVRNGMDEWSTTDIDFLNKYQLLTSKPVIYVVNLTKKAYLTQKSKWLGPVGAHITERGV